MQKAGILHIQRGFTLVEMMVTIAVLVILATVAVPGLQEYAVRSGMAAIRDDFAIALQRTRADAISRNTCVSMCQLASGSTSACAPEAELGQWHQGWLTYVNDSCSGEVPVGGVSAGDVISVRQPSNQRYTLADNLKSGVVTFDARGSLVSGAATYGVKDSLDKDSKHARDIVVSKQGRVVVRLVQPSTGGSSDSKEGG